MWIVPLRLIMVTTPSILFQNTNNSLISHSCLCKSMTGA